MKKAILILLLMVVYACGGGGGSGGGASSGNDDGGEPPGTQPPSLAGVLQVSDLGQPKVIEIDEDEPIDDSAYAQALGPLTPGLAYIVRGAIPPAPDDDEIDIYWLTEPSAQTVVVTLTHGPESDFDIVAYDIDLEGNIQEIGSSTSTTSPDQFSYITPTPSPGESFVTAIAVSWFSGGGPYEMRIEADFTDGSRASAVSSRERTVLAVAGNDHPPPPLEKVWDVSRLDAVPGEVLVKWSSQAVADADPRSLSGAQPNVDLGSLVPCGEVTGIATKLCEASSASARAAINDTAIDGEAQLRRTVGRVLRLRATPGVEDAIPNYLYHPSALPNDEFYPLQWHYPMIGLPEAWDTTQGSSDVIVAVLDTGIVNHPDFEGRLVPGYDLISDPENALDGDGIDADPTDVGDGGGANGTSTWHGTHVAGTIGAVSNNGQGVAGVDWNCKIMTVRVLGKTGGSLEDIMNGILFAAGLPNSTGTLPPQRAHIINMSLSGQDPGGQAVNFYQDAVDRVRQAGVFIVAAAGNQQTSEPAVPAAVPGVMSVSALALTGDLAPYSNFGSTIDITAPGGNISVDTNGDGYSDGVLSTFFDEVAGQPNFKFYQGTSMASPHVAGLAALCLAVNPNLSVSQLENLLISTVTDIGEPGRDDLFGHGLINAAAAVQQAAGVDTNANLELFPSVLNFGADQTRLEVSVVNSGREDLVLNPPAVMTYDGTPWLSATLAAGGEPGVVVTVDRTGVATGRYAGRVTLTSNQGNRVVEVSMAVSTGQDLPDVGQVFVLLVNQATREVVAQAETSQSAGYSYRLSEVEPGAYFLVAGTDADGNGFICESDDFCGAYPVLSEPSVLAVTQESDLTDLDFALTFVGSDLDTTGANDPSVQFWDTLAADGIDTLWRVE